MRVPTARLLTAAGMAAVLLAPPAAAGAAPEPGRSTLHRQSLVWGPCAGVDDPRLSCTTVRVPLDHARPGGRTISVAVSRLAAADPARRRGVLVTTGGGPGEAGVPWPLRLAGILDPRVSAAYDLVGFDLRFLERSTPITCGQPGEEPGGFWVRSEAYQPLETTAAQARDVARACARHAGWALPHATTANAARDLDIIRAALGEPKISFLAGSYAALLGVAYSTLFPHRVDRLVLDSPPSYDAVWRRFEVERTAAMEANHGAFVAWLAANHGTYGFGDTPAAAGSALAALVERADATPIDAGGRRWTAGELGALVVLAAFFEQLWPAVALDVAAIRDGAAPPVPLPAYPPALPGAPADNHTAVNLAFRCGDNAWPRGLEAYRRDLARLSGPYPTYGPANANLGPCAFWPVRRDNRLPLAASRARGGLVLAATGDAAVPLANSVATRGAIRGSRLVTVERRTHTPLLSGEASECMRAAVTDHLLTGRLPVADLPC